MLATGPSSSKYCVIVSDVAVSGRCDGLPLSGFELVQTKDMLSKSGIHYSDVRVIECASSKWVHEELKSMKSLRVVFPMGAKALKVTTGKVGIDKWVLSPLSMENGFMGVRVLPVYDPSRLRKQPELSVYNQLAFGRGREFALGDTLHGKVKRNFLLNPPFNETMDILKMIKKDHDVISVDIETGRNYINTVGFAWSSNDAIAIKTLPSRLSDSSFHALWKAIADILEDQSKYHIYQNFIFETMMFSSYGIKIANPFHDTMIGMKMLWPEFKANLGNVGRFYTNRPYWKDDGKVDSGSESGKKDWGNVRDWDKHLKYNCDDTSGTFEAHLGQLEDIESRGMIEVWQYLKSLWPGITEMCTQGLPIDKAMQLSLKGKLESQVEVLLESWPDLNPSSPKQKLKFLKDKGYKIPKTRNTKGVFTESTNELSLKKMRLTHPKDEDLVKLVEFAHLKKALGSYVNVKTHDDGRIRYMINGHGTETGRYSCSKDPWDKGLNAQTLPKRYRIMFDAPPGTQWFQVDLEQAESRFVAYDAVEDTMIDMIENKKDMHKYVASQIYGKLESDITPAERQLGKKCNHSCTYGTTANTLRDICLKEMDLVLSKKEAEAAIEGFHKSYPKIRPWHKKIESTLWSERKLVTPFGRVRYFYGRLDGNTFREAYAYKPQSTIPDITNHLMLGLLDARTAGELKFNLHLQVHDSLILSAEPDQLPAIAAYCDDTSRWHPKIVLSAGRLIIPVSCEIGSNLRDLKDYGP